MKERRVRNRSAEDGRAALERVLERFEQLPRAGSGPEILCRVERDDSTYLLARFPSSCLRGLTARQQEVALLAGDGHSREAIARKLGITPSCVAKHLERIYRKLDVNSRVRLAKYTILLG